MKTHKGIYYFPSYESAREFAQANNCPTNRIIAYGLGWAIQWHVSGAYVGPNDMTHDGCSFCPAH